MPTSKSQGEEVRIIAGSGEWRRGARRAARRAASASRRISAGSIATPQLGNTQDVACRAWLKKQGYRITQLGGDVKVLPTANPDQLSLFTAGKLDGVWTVEPWVSRLELEANGKILPRAEGRDHHGARLEREAAARAAGAGEEDSPPRTRN